MTTYSSSATLSGTGTLTGSPGAVDWINKPVAKKADPFIDFTWSPVLGAIAFVFNTIPSVYVPAAKPDGTYSTHSTYYYTPVSTPLTFTAQATFWDDREPVEYQWDFGDGTKGWGNPVSHTYNAESLFTRASLFVWDQFGREYFAIRQVYVKSTIKLIVTQPAIAVQSSP
jgi:hypothetical protein